MMLGIFLFWIHYIVSAILFYTLFKKSYVKPSYYKSNEDIDTVERYKHPLWIIILYGFIFLVPVINLIVFIFTMLYESSENDVYYDSFFNKKF